MTDHYFETRFCDFDGAEVPPKRYRTLRWAKARAEKLSLDGCGSIWYQGDVGQPPLEMVRYRDDGVIIDVTEGDGTTYDDGTEYPLDGVPSIIEPGELQFSLWLHDPHGKLAACYFWFEWDPDANQAMWSCDGGAGGSFTWTDDEVTYDEDETRPGSFHPIYRDSWVNAARDLFYGCAAAGN
jgi:hypothetical protein